MKRLGIFLLSISTLSIIFTGCSSEKQESTKKEGDKTIVATTTMLKDLTQEITKDKMKVDGLMGAGVDPHLYKPSAGDVNKLGQADLVIYGGLHLEGQMGEVFKKLKSDNKMILDSSEKLDKSLLISSKDFEGNYDPHIWFDVKVWEEVAKSVEEKVEKLDPTNKEYYKENLDNYLKELDKLDDYVTKRAEEIPKEKRVLVTAHDAFNYFAKKYGFEVRGLQGISTETEASASDLTEIADFIKNREIKAIFIESSVPKKNVEALQEAVKSKGFEVEIGGELYSDSLGDENSGDESYIKTIKHNIDTIVDALK